jgi:hypothetical protein
MLLFDDVAKAVKPTHTADAGGLPEFPAKCTPVEMMSAAAARTAPARTLFLFNSLHPGDIRGTEDLEKPRFRLLRLCRNALMPRQTSRNQVLLPLFAG